MTMTHPTDVGYVSAVVAERDAKAGHRQYRDEDDSDRLAFAMGVTAAVVRTVGSDHIEIVTLTRGRICLQPADMNQGEQIAHTLGCDFPLDHRMLRTAVAASAEAKGLTLAKVLHDESDACTISELVQAAQSHHAARVILPAGVRLAQARQGIERDLAERGAPDSDLVAPRPIPVLAGSRSTEATS